MRGAAFATLILLAAACSANTGGGQPVSPAANPSAAQQPSAAGLPYIIDISPAGYLVDEAGKALYVFDNDTGNTSTCYDQCAQNWPPIVSPDNTAVLNGDGVSGTLSTVERTDGSGFQVSYNGDPLYYFAGDTAAGDTKGDGVGGVWHLAGLAPSSSPASTTPTSTAPTSTAPASTTPGSGGDCYGYYCDDY